MFTHNPIADLSAFIPPIAMQVYLIVMAILVALGTIFDMLHKHSATYFFENAKKAQKSAKRTLGGGEKVSFAIQTVASEVLTSSEFKSTRRRVSHLFTMYGLVVFIVCTVALVFAYPTPDKPAPAAWPILWHVGALSLAFGGYWFWFAIRVDVASEGVKWYKLNGRGDLFIIGLLSTSTFALIWSWTLGTGWVNLVFLGLFLASSTMLFGSVYWSKFAHMFFKPAAAYQKKCIKADGSRENLPDDYNLTDPAVQKRFPDIPEYMGTNPPNMGLGINREVPRHY